MSDRLEVRQVTAEDKPALTRLMDEYIVDFYQAPKPPVEDVHGLIDVMLERREGIQFGAFRGDSMVGFATLYFSWSTVSAKRITVMNDLYVVAEERGSGVAEPLFRACQDYTREHQYARMIWETAADNHRAQRFYGKMGGEVQSSIHYAVK